MSIELEEEERDVVAAEAFRYASRVAGETVREAYLQLAREAAAGRVEEERVAPLSGLLELGLATGRIRALHGAHAEMAAGAVWRRTPRGRALEEEVRAASSALGALAGQKIEGLALSARGPGLYTLTVETEECRLVVALGTGGVEARSLEVAL